MNHRIATKALLHSQERQVQDSLNRLVRVAEPPDACDADEWKRLLCEQPTLGELRERFRDGCADFSFWASKHGPNPLARWCKRFYAVGGKFLMWFRDASEDARVLGCYFLPGCVVHKEKKGNRDACLCLYPCVPRRPGDRYKNLLITPASGASSHRLGEEGEEVARWFQFFERFAVEGGAVGEPQASQSTLLGAARLGMPQTKSSSFSLGATGRPAAALLGTAGGERNRASTAVGRPMPTFVPGERRATAAHISRPADPIFGRVEHEPAVSPDRTPGKSSLKRGHGLVVSVPDALAPRQRSPHKDRGLPSAVEKQLLDDGFSAEQVKAHTPELLFCADVMNLHDYDKARRSQALLPTASNLFTPPSSNMGASRSGVAGFIDLPDALFSLGDPRDCHTDLSLIGTGGQGEVYRAVTAHNVPVALKRINLRKPATELKALANELRILVEASHENIVRFIHCYEASHRQLWVSMEFVDGGKLADIIGAQHPPFNDADVAYVAQGLCSALAYLHERQVLHRDIKSDNVLLNRRGQVKLADFGMGADIASKKYRETVVGTPYWMAPEVIKGSPYDDRADVWSIGIVCIEMVDGEPPLIHMSKMSAMMTILSLPPPAPVKEVSDECAAFIGCMLQSESCDRPTAREAHEHPFVTTVAHASGDAFLARHSVAVPATPTPSTPPPAAPLASASTSLQTLGRETVSIPPASVPSSLAGSPNPRIAANGCDSGDMSGQRLPPPHGSQFGGRNVSPNSTLNPNTSNPNASGLLRAPNFSHTQLATLLPSKDTVCAVTPEEL
eukprot:TRINITY_DN6415_c0_g1_i1.p1 TRINITY_DN6415_c0_g1~~TRINITY_DN6415_c0_g1_i1.p1  ORF type:complete len:790 (+),score=192.78 TRINITY_DN6415_c0_g1_i1:108-2477(+)